MSRLIAVLLAVVLVLVAPAAMLSWHLGNGLRRDTRAQGAAVRLYAGPVGIATGRIWRLQFTVRRAALDDATARELRGTLHDVTLDLSQAVGGRLAIRSIKGGRIAVVVDESDVQRFLAESRDVRGARVRLDDGLVTITGTVDVLNSSFPIQVSAHLAIEGSALVLRVAALHISGVAIPSNLGDVLMTAVNPLLVAPREPVPMRFTGVRVDNGRAVITGEPEL
jgi:hypothetical protein